MKHLVNPFVISGYEGDRYFCDRVLETQQLAFEIENGNNVALIATRRMGKSGLIQHFFNLPEVKDKYYTFFIDIYDTHSLREFVIKLGREIATRLKPHGSQIVQRFWDIAHSLQAGISFSPMGDLSFNVQVGDIRESTATLDEIFRFLAAADKPCIVAIDEFQQIGNYSDSKVEATLRTYVQQCRNAQFIFAGSQRHIMNSMFTSPARPFFQSVSIMQLGAIDLQRYEAFALAHFEQSGRHLAQGVTEAVYAISQGVTWYTQKMFNTLYANTPVGATCTLDDVQSALDYIIRTLAYTFEETLFRLPEKQKMLLVALAKAGPSKSLTAASFLQKNALPSASMVQSALRGLLAKDFVTSNKGVYTVYDLFFSIWMKQQY